MHTIDVALGERSYPIHIGENVMERAGELLAPALRQPRVIVVTDSNVAPIYLQPLRQNLEAAGVEVAAITLPAGEQTKSFSIFEGLMEDLLACNPERKTTLIALGGGVIGDITGFAASILLRGVPFVQVPTTLLAQVDSAVGGKTAINSKHGKNLIGAFYQPQMVITDVNTLNTLPERERQAGYAEVLKYGLIGDKAFFDWLKQNGLALLEGNADARIQAIRTSCEAKAQIVAEDEREAGRRALLNLGHTFGHALEKAVGYTDKLLHGEAVALGCVMAYALSVEKGWCTQEELDAVTAHLKQVRLPTHLSDVEHAWDAKELTAYCHQDKKVQDGKLTFIVPRAIGEAVISHDITDEEVEAIFCRYGA